MASAVRASESDSLSTVRCLLVATDGVHNIEPVLVAAEGFVDEQTDKILLAQVVPPSDPGGSFTTQRDAQKFRARFDIPVETVAISGTSVAGAIAELARREEASLIITRSWHHEQWPQPHMASNSRAIVAEAPCPVLIVN